MTVAECFLTSCAWARFLIGSHTMPGQKDSQPTPTSLGQGVCVFRCNLPPALLTEWPGSFTCHCGNTGAERTPNKCQHTKLTLEKKILPPLLPGFELATFWSRVRRSYQQAIPELCYINSDFFPLILLLIFWTVVFVPPLIFPQLKMRNRWLVHMDRCSNVLGFSFCFIRGCKFSGLLLDLPCCIYVLKAFVDQIRM